MPRPGRHSLTVALLALVVLAGPAAVALAGHSVRFAQSKVAADSEVTLELRVPEAGEGHNPEGTRDHHTTQVRVSIPAAFEALGCVPPDGWDCARTGELFRFFQEDDLQLNRPDSFDLGLYLRTPDANGSWGFRTIQVYNDGHETRFTVEGGTAPTVATTGAEPPSPSPSPSPSRPAPSPEPSATPSQAPSPSPEPTEPAADPSPSAGTATPAPTATPSPTAAPTPSATPATPAPSPTEVADDGSPEDVVAGDRAPDEPPGTPGGMDGLERAALSLLIISGGWSVVEFRARRRRGAP